MKPLTVSDQPPFISISQTRINRFIITALEQQAPRQQTDYYTNNDYSITTLIGLHQAIGYCLHNGGKRLRPSLVYATAQINQQTIPSDCDWLAAALECLHSYSLVHDDLPAMDNDALRRGKPTCHIAYDEATAILVGDALQALAFEWLTRLENTPAPVQIQLIQLLSRAVGMHGMVGGQHLDLKAEQRALNLPALQSMHQRKTGALIRTSVLAAAHLIALPSQTIATLDTVGQNLGLAFQICDDILDIESNTATLGKPNGSDDKNHKATYPQLMGLSHAKHHMQQLTEQTMRLLEQINGDTTALQEIAAFTVNRVY